MGQGNDSLDVASLSALDGSLRRPFEEWPTVDLKTEVTWSPRTPKPGEVVRFTFSITNVGRRDADRAEVTIYISMPLNNQDLKDIRRYWFPRVPAGKTVSSRHFGAAGARRCDDCGPSRRERDVQARARINGEDNDVVAEIPLTPLRVG